MNKKRLMLACAIGALVLLAGSGVARCAMQPSEDPATGQEKESTQKADADGIKSYLGTAWSADGGSKTMTIADGVVIEREGDSTSVTYYEVVSERSDAGGISVNVTTTKTPRDAPAQGVMRIDASTEEVSITCDAFALSTTYILDAAPDVKVALSAHSDKLNELLESDDESISNALSAWASKRSPYATSAAWDGEVYIDCNGKTVTTSFTLNDGASTLVQLRYDQTTKELSAL